MGQITISCGDASQVQNDKKETLNLDEEVDERRGEVRAAARSIK